MPAATRWRCSPTASSRPASAPPRRSLGRAGTSCSRGFEPPRAHIRRARRMLTCERSRGYCSTISFRPRTAMPKNLLLADDSITIQKVVGITFAGEDFRVTTVDNGEDAIVRARELKPDVILADVVMPRKNGYEVCQVVKSDPALQHIPVLLLAGTFEAFDERRAQSVRADGHIAKPFESQALIT